MKELKLTKEQEILFEVYDKGVQNEDCDLDAYVEKMKQALSIAFVSQQRELLKAYNIHLFTEYSNADYTDLDIDNFLDSL